MTEMFFGLACMDIKEAFLVVVSLGIVFGVPFVLILPVVFLHFGSRALGHERCSSLWLSQLSWPRLPVPIGASGFYPLLLACKRIVLLQCGFAQW